MHTDGTNETKLNDHYSFSLEVIGDWIYYFRGDYGKEGIYKMKIDDTDNSKLCDDMCNTIKVERNWIYYSNNTDDNSLYKI